MSANGALHASNTTKPVARREGAGVGLAVGRVELGLDAGARRRTMTCRGTDLQKHKGVTLRSLGDSTIARERLKNVREDRRSTLEDCVRKNTGQKKQKCKNCEGKGTPKKGDKIVRCRRCGGTGIKP